MENLRLSALPYPQSAPPPVLPMHGPPTGAEEIDQLMRQGDHDAALRRLRPRLASGLADVREMDQAASCLWELGDARAATDLMATLVDTQPQLGSPCVKLAAWALGTGDRERARAALDLGFARG